MFTILEVPLILFCAIVAPVWIIFHYKSRDKQGVKEVGEDRNKIETLLLKADKMEERLKTLEAILDREQPNWRAEI